MVVVEMWTVEGKFVIINYYSPCRRTYLDKLTQIKVMDGDRVMVCGDFNAQSTLQGGIRTYIWGGHRRIVREEQMVCINGRGTRKGVCTGNTSVLDLTLVSGNVGRRREWDVSEVTSIGSDHFPVFSNLLPQRNKRQANGYLLVQSENCLHLCVKGKCTK